MATNKEVDGEGELMEPNAKVKQNRNRCPIVMR